MPHLVTNAQARELETVRVQLSRLSVELAARDDVSGVIEVREMAALVQDYARRIGAGLEMQNDAAQLKLDAERKAGSMLAAMRERGERAGQGGDKAKSQAVTLPELGVAKMSASRWQRAATVPETAYRAWVQQTVDAGDELTSAGLLKHAAAEQTRQRREASRSAPVLTDGMDLRYGDCRDVLADVPDASVPLIITDPPYGDAAEPLYEWLADFAARTLIPGGSLIVYTGQSRLDRDMRIFGQRLRYWWLLSMLHTRAQRLPGKFVNVEFKPVLWYVNGHRRGRQLVNDVLRPPKPDKTQHDWGQAEGGVTFLIENLTDPGELIVDPFAGTATWGQITTSMGRRWLGAEVEPDTAKRGEGVIAA